MIFRLLRLIVSKYSGYKSILVCTIDNTHTLNTNISLSKFVQFPQYCYPKISTAFLYFSFKTKLEFPAKVYLTTYEVAIEFVYNVEQQGKLNCNVTDKPLL